MSEQYQTFIVPPGDRASEEELNRFIRGHRVLRVMQHFEMGCWQFCVAWESGAEAADRTTGRGSPKIDYREVLDASTFAIFAELRELRKEFSNSERVPAYAVFTNEQLAMIAKGRCASVADLKKIEGLGEGRIEKYGEAVLERIRKHAEQQNQTGADRRSGEPA